MDIFGVLTLIGGLALFLYGMNVMGAGLEKMSGGKLEKILETLTSNPIKAVLLGAGVTAVIQSSSATTVMVVGFVNSGIMKLSQAVGIIMGANIGTTVTSWLLSLSGLQGDNFFIQMLKPSSFSPILAMIGIILCMSKKSDKKKDIGEILLGFAVLMYGMESMERGGRTACRCAGIYEYLNDVPQSVPWCIGRSCTYCDHTEFLCIGRNFTGTVCNRSIYLWFCDPDHYGTEYRYLCDGNDFSNRGKQRCKENGICTSLFQCNRYDFVFGIVLYRQCADRI